MFIYFRNMQTYYIYHIPGVKIGCSKNPKLRVKRQGYNDYKILEIHTCVDMVTQREKELQEKYGYAVDRADYKQTLEFGKKGQSKGGAAGSKSQIKNKIGMYGYSKEERYKINLKGASIGGAKQSQVIRECPHCGKVGKGNAMFAYHFDRCKLKNN